jgi:hypothetical protein
LGMKDLEPPEQTDDGGSVVVYRTGIIYEFDMVADAMTRAGIPYFRRRESIGGFSFAMPVMPSMAPGDMYAIVVPETWADPAKHFIAALPVSQGIRLALRPSGRPRSSPASGRGFLWLV